MTLLLAAIFGLALLALGLVLAGYPLPAIAVVIYAAFLLALHRP